MYYSLFFCYYMSSINWHFNWICMLIKMLHARTAENKCRDKSIKAYSGMQHAYMCMYICMCVTVYIWLEYARNAVWYYNA